MSVLVASTVKYWQNELIRRSSMYAAVQVFVTCWCIDKLLSSVTPRFLTRSEKSTWGSLGHHRWFHNQFPPFSLVLHCPLGLGKLQACPFPGCCLPTSSSVCCLPPGFTVPCEMVFARPYEWETWPYHCSLRLFICLTTVQKDSLVFFVCLFLVADFIFFDQRLADQLY